MISSIKMLILLFICSFLVLGGANPGARDTFVHGSLDDLTEDEKRKFAEILSNLTRQKNKTISTGIVDGPVTVPTLLVNLLLQILIVHKAELPLNIFLFTIILAIWFIQAFIYFLISCKIFSFKC